MTLEERWRAWGKRKGPEPSSLPRPGSSCRCRCLPQSYLRRTRLSPLSSEFTNSQRTGSFEDCMDILVPTGNFTKAQSLVPVCIPPNALSYQDCKFPEGLLPQCQQWLQCSAASLWGTFLYSTIAAMQQRIFVIIHSKFLHPEGFIQLSNPLLERE